MFKSEKKNLETQEVIIYSWTKQLLFEKSLLWKEMIIYLAQISRDGVSFVFFHNLTSAT